PIQAAFANKISNWGGREPSNANVTSPSATSSVAHCQRRAAGRSEDGASNRTALKMLPFANTSSVTVIKTDLASTAAPFPAIARWEQLDRLQKLHALRRGFHILRDHDGKKWRTRHD